MLLCMILTADGASLGVFPALQCWGCGPATVTSHAGLPRSLLTGTLASVPAPQPSVLRITRHEALLSCPKATTRSHVPPSEMATADVFFLHDFEGTDINIMIITGGSRRAFSPKCELTERTRDFQATERAPIALFLEGSGTISEPPQVWALKEAISATLVSVTALQGLLS